MLLGLNLLASLPQRWRGFVRKPLLGLFHAGMLALVVLGTLAGPLSWELYVEVAEGQRRALGPLSPVRGAWAPERLDGFAVTAERVEGSYWRGDASKEAVAALTVHRPDGRDEPVEVRPQRPVTVDGLRFLLTPDRGYAAVFALLTRGQPPQRGVIYFPNYAKNPRDQTQQLFVPGSVADIRARLKMAPVRREGAEWTLVVPADAHVELTRSDVAGPQRLKAGDAVPCGADLLRLDGIGRYAGLLVTWDPIGGWILALSIALPLLLLAHYLVPERWRRRRGEA
jgi:hypothetical protein